MSLRKVSLNFLRLEYRFDIWADLGGDDADLSEQTKALRKITRRLTSQTSRKPTVGYLSDSDTEGSGRKLSRMLSAKPESDRERLKREAKVRMHSLSQLVAMYDVSLPV